MKKIYIIGVGPGREEYLLPISKREIERADCLVGSERLLALFRNLKKEEVLIKGHFETIIPYIKRYKSKKKIAVLVSGDPGMYSLLEKISKVLKPQEYEVIPGISMVQLSFARIGENWSDAKIVSLHGRKTGDLTGEVRASKKVFLFTDSNFPPDRIAAYLLNNGLENRRAVVLENCAHTNEKVIDTDLRRLTEIKGWGLCVMIIEARKCKTAKGKLYGIGIGPGDPKLVTLKAKEILDSVDTIFVPKGSEEGVSCSRSIVEAITYAPKNFVELTFPMTKEKRILDIYWKNAVARIVKEIRKGNDVAFVTLGDPSIYSTYIYLLRTLRKNLFDVDIETIPGISAFNAAASVTGFSLVEGDERLAVVPVTKNLIGLKGTLKEFDTVVLMKVGSKLTKVISLLEELNLAKNAVLVSRVGHKDEKIIYDVTSLRDKKAGYLSVVIVKKALII